MLVKAICFLKEKGFKEAGIISVDIYSMSIHVTIDVIKKSGNLFLEDRGSVDFPYFVKCEVDGVTVYAIATEEELRENFPNLLKRAEKEEIFVNRNQPAEGQRFQSFLQGVKDRQRES